jgi:hypothetical protein
MRLPITRHTPIDAYVMVTSVIGAAYVTDVEVTPTRERQWFRYIPTPLTDPTHAFAWAAASALDHAAEDYLTRDVWLIIGGRVADHAHIRGI